MKELRMLCAEDEQGRTCWMTAFRLFKVGLSSRVQHSGVQEYTRYSRAQ